MTITEQEFEAGNERGRAMREGPTVVQAYYDQNNGRVVLDLSNGSMVAFPPGAVQELEGALSADLDEIEITPSGLSIGFPKCKAGLYLPALLHGVFGSERWIAARLAAAGGSATSPAKAEAARRNGARGGRPNKRTGAVVQ